MEIRFESTHDKSENELRRIWEVIPPGRSEELKQIKQEQIRRQSLIGEWLVRQMLEEKTGIRANLILIERNENKKPRLAGDAYYFNISHSGTYVMAAVSEKPIGADIEKITRDPSRALQRICSKEDWRYIEEAADQEMRMQRLYEIWTRKEALVKCIGSGIFAREIKETVGHGGKRIIIEKNHYYLQTINGPKGYCCAVCELEN